MPTPSDGPTSPGAHRRFSITALARDAGFTQMAELAAANSVPYEVTPVARRTTMTYDLSRQSLGGMILSQVHAGNYRAVRSERLTAGLSEPRLILQAPHGLVETEQSGQRVRGDRGALVAMWSIAPLRTEIVEPTTVSAIDLPLVDVQLPHRMLRELMGRDLGASPMGRVVTTYVRELVQTELSDEERDATGPPTLDLICALLALAAGDVSYSRDPLGRTIGTRIMLYLRAHLADPELTPDRVAAKFSISRRYLYVILNKMGLSLGEWIRKERLAAAALALADPRQHEIPVSSIARRVGFVDHSTFSRAFRAEYGCSPTDWRERTDHASSG